VVAYQKRRLNNEAKVTDVLPTCSVSTVLLIALHYTGHGKNDTGDCVIEMDTEQLVNGPSPFLFFSAFDLYLRFIGFLLYRPLNPGAWCSSSPACELKLKNMQMRNKEPDPPSGRQAETRELQ
jgi:hypothetical protein